MTAWYDKATFYHMYPLGMTGSPFANPYPVSDGAADGTNRDVSADSRMDELMLWIPYLESLHISAIYIGPLFESSTHPRFPAHRPAAGNQRLVPIFRGLLP